MQLAGGTATIETRIGAIDDQATFRIENGTVIDSHFIMHYPIPMRQAWDTVVYTCLVMLFFRDESQVDDWCATRGVPKGNVRHIGQVWEFAAEWYARHADAKWIKWTVQEAVEIFNRNHLTGPIWTHSKESSRF